MLDLVRELNAQEPIFIFSSSHRCGSTLLQRFLNSNEQILIWGEHDGFLNWLCDGFWGLRDWSENNWGERLTFVASGYDSFLPKLTPEPEKLDFAAAYFIWSMFGLPARDWGRTIWGFKEVRYNARLAVFLQALFPRARFIYLTRHVHDCFLSLKRWESSGLWTREWTLNSLRMWLEINESFAEHEGRLRKLLSLRYEDLVGSQPSACAALLGDFLSLPAESFDASVFERRLSGRTNDTEQVSLQLNDEELKLINSPQFLLMLERLNYGGK